MFDAHDLTRVPPSDVESRAITFENPTGARGAGGTVAGGRKGAPFQLIEAGERRVLADIEGPGVVRHIWMTFPLAPPEVMRAKLIEVFYDDADEPSISVPAVDLFGVPWGRPVPLDSALAAIGEGRGYNLFIPMPFKRRIRIEYVNASAQRSPLYYQVDHTLEPLGDVTYLHASYRRQNPTVMREDFVIADGFRGPGRFLGCVVGVRVLDGGVWYGEGEVKVFLDGDTSLPTICGTGLEDYVGTAWGMGAHQSLYMGAPLDVRPPGSGSAGNPDFVGFYRWHVPDPIVFQESLKVTIQQIGAEVFVQGQEDAFAAADARVAGTGWMRFRNAPGLLGFGICERSDDYCATAFVMCRDVQAVPRVQLDDVITDIERKEHEVPGPFENSLLSELDPA